MQRSTEYRETLNVLLVEDDEIDRMAVKRAFKRKDLPVNIVEAIDGREALDIVYGRNGYAAPPAPYIILLDINMPQMNGLEMLGNLRAETRDPKLRDSIVFMLTTSEAEKDLEQAYAHHVAGYLLKSADRGGIDAIVDMLWNYNKVVVYP